MMQLTTAKVEYKFKNAHSAQGAIWDARLKHWDWMSNCIIFLPLCAWRRFPYSSLPVYGQLDDVLRVSDISITAISLTEHALGFCEERSDTGLLRSLDRDRPLSLSVTYSQLADSAE